MTEFWRNINNHLKARAQEKTTIFTCVCLPMRRLQSLTNVDKRGRPRETTSEIVQAIRTVKGGGILRNIPYPSKMNGLKCVVALVVLSCVVLHSVEGFTSAYGHSIRLNNKAKPDPQRQRRLTTVQSYISQIKRQENNEVRLRTLSVFFTISFLRYI